MNEKSGPETMAHVVEDDQGAVVPPVGLPIAPAGAVLRPIKAAEAVAREIVGEICRRGLQPGARLLSEADMINQFGVSRESLREGLRLLEVQGLITLRRGPGGGPVVGTVDPANLGRMQSTFFQLTAANYEELFEAWRLAQGILGERAASNPDAERRRRLMTPYTSGREPEEEVTLFVESHGGFHAAVAQLGDNKVLELTLESYGQLVSHSLAVFGDPRELHLELEDAHRDVALAVIDGDSDRARELMEKHIEDTVAAIKRSIGSKLPAIIEWV